MARSFPDTAKHLIRVLRKGGATAALLYKRLTTFERDMLTGVVKRIGSGATEAQTIAYLRQQFSGRRKMVLETLEKEALKVWQQQARSTGAYLEVLTAGGAAVKVPLVSKSRVTAAFNTPLGDSRITVFDLADGANIASLRTFRNGIRTAFRDGLTNREIARMVEDLSADLFTPRYKIEAVARTAIQKIANESRMQTYQANSDIIKAYLFSATLDSRTSSICMSLDGETVAINDAAKVPPLHPNCRSTLIPILHGETAEDVKKELTRPQVIPKSKEEYLARKHTKAGKKPSKTSRSGLERKDGSKYVDYSSWLSKQPVYYQKDILGARAYAKYAQGGKTKAAFLAALGKT